MIRYIGYLQNWVVALVGDIVARARNAFLPRQTAPSLSTGDRTEVLALLEDSRLLRGNEGREVKNRSEDTRHLWWRRVDELLRVGSLERGTGDEQCHPRSVFRIKRDTATMTGLGLGVLPILATGGAKTRGFSVLSISPCDSSMTS